MKALSIEQQDLERVSAIEAIDVDCVTSFLEAGQEDRRVESFEEARSDIIIDGGRTTRITVLDQNALSRTCLLRCLTGYDPSFVIDVYRDLAEWHPAMIDMPGRIVLLCATGQKSTEMVIHQDLMGVVEAVPNARVVIVSDFEAPSEIAYALEVGAKGYISMNFDVDVAVAAIRLVKAGGIFVPASSLLALRSVIAASSESSVHEQLQGPFTQREFDVITHLRQGEPNKLIAYRLGLGECTVKVHVHNVMRKINARSRTEIAFLTNDLFDIRTRPLLATSLVQ
jgi:DNA-binding NarL/FixJ family response regulator